MDVNSLESDTHLGPIDMESPSLFTEVDDSATFLGQTSTFTNGNSYQNQSKSTIAGALAAKRSTTFG